MTDRKNGPFASIAKAILHIISWFYGIISSLIRFGYKIKLLKAQKPNCKVISIGNISLGGTGKTPTACMLAGRLKGQKRTVAVLIRGYGTDEWRMIKDFLGQIPVVVGPDRVKGSEYAVSRFGVDTVLLDDGFQHWRIKRDLDIVLIDSSNPFGNGRLFPRGVLRERPSALKRADMILLTKTDMKKNSLEAVKNTLKEIVPEVPLMESIYRPKYLYNLSDREEIDISSIKARPIAVLSSIVNTEYFEFILRNLGADIKLQFRYPDHYRYREKDVTHIITKCEEANVDTVVTTEKDAVKLTAYSLHLTALNVLVLHVEPEITKGEDILDSRLDSLYSD